jgi:putative tricarboxylic transport membrane protein
VSNLYQNLFAGIFLAVGIGYEAMALSMPVGGFGSPGPGLFPMLVGAALILTAAACLVQNLLSTRRAAANIDPSASPETRTVEHGKAWLLVAALILYVLALKPVGFPIALTLLLIASVRIFGYRNWLRNLAMSLLMTGIAYVVFIVWLKVPLPLGIVAELLE